MASNVSGSRLGDGSVPGSRCPAGLALTSSVPKTVIGFRRVGKATSISLRTSRTQPEITELLFNAHGNRRMVPSSRSTLLHREHGPWRPRATAVRAFHRRVGSVLAEIHYGASFSGPKYTPLRLRDERGDSAVPLLFVPGGEHAFRTRATFRICPALVTVGVRRFLLSFRKRLPDQFSACRHAALHRPAVLWMVRGPTISVHGLCVYWNVLYDTVYELSNVIFQEKSVNGAGYEESHNAEPFRLTETRLHLFGVHRLGYDRFIVGTARTAVFTASLS
jgi:hypothetical protein